MVVNFTHAEPCPLCHGTGQLDTPEGGTRVCHGCDGKGWVVVQGVGMVQQPVYYMVPSHISPYWFDPLPPYPYYKPGEVVVTCKGSSDL